MKLQKKSLLREMQFLCQNAGKFSKEFVVMGKDLLISNILYLN